MIPLNHPPTTLAHKMAPEQWRNIANCSTTRHRLLRESGSTDWDRHSREHESWAAASALEDLSREPFPIVVCNGIRHYGKVPTWDGLMIDRSWHIEQSVNGSPIALPDYLDSMICDQDKDWQDRVCAYLATVNDRNRDYLWQDVSLNGENDLSGEIYLTAFYPADSPDSFWSRDSFLEVDGRLYDLSDSTIADCGILETSIGWYVCSLEDGEFLEGFDRLAIGYSHNPTRELREMLKGWNGRRWADSQPVWHHGLKCFVGRLAGHDRPVRLHPELPCYGG